MLNDVQAEKKKVSFTLRMIALTSTDTKPMANGPTVHLELLCLF